MLSVQVKLEHQKTVAKQKYLGRMQVLVTVHLQVMDTVLRLEMNQKVRK